MDDYSWIRQDVQFACDRRKRFLVLSEHKIDLFDASAVFFDPFFLSDYDVEHSVTEDRYKILGKMPSGKLVRVSYMVRANVVRLITARKATKKEGELYEQQ